MVSRMLFFNQTMRFFGLTFYSYDARPTTALSSPVRRLPPRLRLLHLNDRLGLGGREQSPCCGSTVGGEGV